MSQENVEVVRAIYDAWSNDRSAAPFIEKDLEYVNPPDAVEPGTKRGRRFLAAPGDVWSDMRIEPERFVDAGEDVLVVAIMRGRSASGFEIEWRQGHIWTIRNGKAIRFCWFNSPKDAFEAAGLSEQDVHADS